MVTYFVTTARCSRAPGPLAFSAGSSLVYQPTYSLAVLPPSVMVFLTTLVFKGSQLWSRLVVNLCDRDKARLTRKLIGPLPTHRCVWLISKGEIGVKLSSSFHFWNPIGCPLKWRVKWMPPTGSPFEIVPNWLNCWKEIRSVARNPSFHSEKSVPPMNLLVSC